ncbi:UDP-2,3-diacylglucosamine diphosphatase [Pseudoalteromonas sp. MM17-2]|uniref:UDP-2,3-diacylglucosamine diphosphatase n=1 Tax=Pseudoalteromonas sp. MM17-2 TaxID=2917753 RepID=UPI001EF5D256|nr:UDP-2,3-diacylglucosamine diphosphatase [Pseudoalteromonas sp. MM17-2]MCG7543105.1 UDP-2,3-diacylglucosamine diphosphatase [Pseudoalteromonas sp. MM17-2]
MSRTLFIADLHLSSNQPEITGAFFDFLDKEIDQQVDALYILGDFFEVWVGDDASDAFSDDIAARLKQLADQGIAIYFTHGNRDFLLGQRYAQKAGMTLLAEQTVIDLYGTQVLLLHGDEMCTQDLEYQRFRRKSRGWWWPRLMLAMPLWYRRRVAKKARAKSKQSQQHKATEILDVERSAVLDTFSKHQVRIMIHGHTHRPAVHQYDQEQTRIVLGDWYEQSSFLVVDKQHMRLHYGDHADTLTQWQHAD